MNIALIVVLALVVEALVEYTKLIFVNKTVNWKQLVALCVGIAIAILANADLFTIFQINFIVPYVGSVLTGIVISRGANYLADFIKKLQIPKEE